MEENPGMDMSAGLLPTPVVETAVKTAREPLQFERRDIWLALVMLLNAYLCVKLVLSVSPGLGTTVFVLCLCATVLWWMKTTEQTRPAAGAVYLALFLLCGAYFVLFDSILLKLLALLLALLLFVYSVLAMRGLRAQERLGQFLFLDLWDGLFLLPLRHFTSAPRLLGESVKNSRHWRNAALVVLGVLIALPLSVYVAAMLRSADQAFANLWQRLAEHLFDNIVINLLQFTCAVPLAFYLFGLLFGAKQSKTALHSEEKVRELGGKAQILPQLLVIGTLTPLLAIYMVFFFAQSAYFLSAFQGLLPDGYIHAEYARRGFFELCDVSAVNFVMILVLRLLAKRTGAKQRLLDVYSVVLALCSVAMIVIAMRKMLLYIEHFGLTQLRLYTSVFMLLLLLVFSFVMLKTFRPGFAVVKWSAAAAVALFLALAFSNPDMQIARYNVERYADGTLSYLDVDLLAGLGSPAIPYLIEVAEMEGATAFERAYAAQILETKWRWGACSIADWRAFNYQRYRSGQMLEAYAADQGWTYDDESRAEEFETADMYEGDRM